MAYRRRPTRTFVQRYLPLLLAGVAILVVVGLRTDDNLGVDLGRQLEDRAADQPAGNSTSTTDPGTDATGTVPPATTDPHLEDPDDAPASLRRALLTAADLPEGWRATELPGGGTAVCPGHDPADDVDPEHAVLASFAAGDDGPYLTSVVAELGSDDEADEYLDAVTAALDDCDGVEDNGLTYETERTEDVDLGDRTVTATLTIHAPAGELRGRIVAVRVGERVASVAFTSGGDADASVAVDAIEQVVARLAD